MTVKILTPPANVPGFNMTELMKDVVRAAYSADVTLTSDLAVTTLFRVPANTIVTQAVIEVITALDGTLSSDDAVDIGDSDDADALLHLECATTKIAGHTQVGGLAKRYSAAQDIILTPTLADITAGKVRVWLEYKTDSDTQHVG